MNYLAETQPWDFQSKEFVIAAALLGSIFVIGLVGNVIVMAVITVLRRRGQKTSVQMFLLNLAISDLMVCLLCIPLTMFTNFYFPTEYHTRDLGLCKLSRFTQHFSPVISVSLLTAISIDRYMTFVKQELTRTQRAWYLRPTWLIFFAWLYGISQTLPVFYTADVIPIDYKNSTVYYCTTTQGHSISGRIYLFVSILLGFVIPLAVLTVSYYRVIRVVWTRKRRFSSSIDREGNTAITNAKLLKRTRQRVLRVLVIVVICYVTCWLPFALYHGILERYLKESPNPMDAVRLITYGLGIVNSICNPFIYYFNVGGKSFHSMKKSFIEVMGGRARTLSQTTVGRSVNLSNSTCMIEVPGNMMELGFHANNVASLTNALPSSQGDDIDTRL